MSQPGIALVGAGAYGEFCLAAFNEMPEVQIAAVVDTNFERAQRFASLYQSKAYDSLGAALADPQVQIVALNTPPFLHAAQGIEILRAGRHLFCEKPLALDLDQGQQMLQVATEHR